MKKFDKLIEEIAQAIENGLPKSNDKPYEKPMNGVPIRPDKSQKRNENDQGKIAGKYFKGIDNTRTKMVSDRDKALNTRKGSMKRTLDQVVSGYSKVISQKTFDRLFDAGERSIEFSDNDQGEWKSVNSKTGEYQVRKLADGRVKIRKARQKDLR